MISKEDPRLKNGEVEFEELVGLLPALPDIRKIAAPHTMPAVPEGTLATSTNPRNWQNP